MSPGAEVAVLQVYVVGQSDRLVNFVSWFAMLASLVVVSHLAKRMGAGPTGQWFGVVFAAAIPMGIVQASSTMTDYVLASGCCVAAEVDISHRRAGDPIPGLATGSDLDRNSLCVPAAVCSHRSVLLLRFPIGRVVATVAAAGLC
jgi:hypothetical protein